MDFITQFISEELAYALGWTLLHSLWQAMLIALIVALAMTQLQQRSARLRYEVFSLSLFLVFVLSLCTFLLLYDTAAQIPIHEIHLSAIVATEGGHIHASPVQQFLQSGIHYFDQHIPLIATLWLIGAAFFLLRLLGAYGYVQHLRYQHNIPVSDYWQRRMSRLSGKLRLRKRVELLESTLAKMPMVIGYMKPVILFPMGALNNLTVAEVEAILAHELAHIHRNDYLLNIILSFIEVLFYYNPAVWWLSANIRMERENCCDDIAIKLCGNSLTYAKALVSLQEINHQVPAFAMSFSRNRQHLLQRIRRILNQPENQSHIREKLIASCLLLSTILFLSVSANNTAKSADLINHLGGHHTMVFEGDVEGMDWTVDVDMEDHIIVRTTVRVDTVPDKLKMHRGKSRIIKTEDGQKLELNVIDGEIISFKIDGKEVPSGEMEEYRELANELMEELVSPPEPPAPPQPDFAVPAPPAPPAVRSAPKAPKPPSAPQPRSYRYEIKTKKEKKITTEQNDYGETIIKIESDENGEPLEIIVNGDNQFIVIDGNKLESGDTAIIIENNHGGLPRTFNYIEIPDLPDVNMGFLSWEEDMGDSFEKLKEKYGDEWPEKLHEGFALKWDGYNDYLNLLNERMTDYAEERGEALKEYEFRWDDNIQKKLKKKQKRTKKQMRELQDRYHSQLKQLKKLDKHPQYYYFHNDGLFNRNILEEEMLRDGLIQDRTNYSFELSNKKFKVNGKRQSKALTKKYVQLYLKSTGQKPGDQFHIKIKQ